MPVSRASILELDASISACSCSRVFPDPRELELPPMASSSASNVFILDLYSERRFSRSVNRCCFAWSSDVELLLESSAL